MTIPDAAIEAAAAELVRQETAGCCTLGKVCGLCDCFAERDGGATRDGYARQHARAAVEAAMPAIREAFGDALHDHRLAEVGTPRGDWQDGYAEGLHQAEYIVRGGTP